MARRWAAVAFLIVLAVLALGPMRNFATQQREVVEAVPGGYTGLEVPFRVKPGSELCATSIPFGSTIEIARIGAVSVGRRAAPAMRLVLRGESEAATWRPRPIPVKGGWRGRQRLDIPLPAPPSPLLGTFCLRNTGRSSIDILGTSNGRARARPDLALDGVTIPEQELSLTLLRRGTRSLPGHWDQMLDRAAFFWPGGGWLLWVLTVAVAAGVPLALLRALSLAAAADEAAPRRRAAPSLPLPRARAWVGSLDARWLVIALAVVAGLWLLRWALRSHAFQNDDDQYVYLGRWLAANGLGHLFDFDLFGRGLQRLEIWQIAFWQWLLPGSPATLTAAHATNAAAFASTAIPVYLLAAGLGARRGVALLAAALSVVTPFAVVGTSFLAEPLAYPAATWVAWAAWRTVVAPSLGADVRFVALVAMAGLARSSMLVLFAVAPLAIAWQDLRLGGGGFADRARASLSAHKLIWAVTAAGLLALLLRAAGADPTGGLIDRVAGGYGTHFDFAVGAVAEKSARQLSRVAVGTGVLPAIVALAWAAGRLRRADDRLEHAAAATFVAMTVALLYSLTTAGPDERYILYLVPPVLVGAAVAVSGRSLRPGAVAISSALVAFLLLRVPWPAKASDYDFFTYPVGMFYRRALAERLTTVYSGDVGTMLTLIPLAALLAGLFAALAIRRSAQAPGGSACAAAWPAAPVAIALVALLVLAQADYALKRYVYSAGNGNGPSLAERAWIDRAAGARAVAQFAAGSANSPFGNALWTEAQFYNDRLSRVLTDGDPEIAIKPPDPLSIARIDARSGRVQIDGAPPSLVVQSVDAGVPPLRGKVVATAGYVPLQMIEPELPLRLAWRASGLSASGWMRDDGSATVRFYGGGLPAGEHCAALFLGGTPDADLPYEIRAGSALRRGTVAQGAITRVTLPLAGLSGRSLDATIRVEGTGTTPEGRGGPRLAGVAIDDDCAAR